MKTNKIIHGDSLQELKKLPEKSINCVMTSPPYWALRDYGTATWECGDPNCDHKVSGNLVGSNSIMKQEQADRCKHYKDICKKCGAKRVDKQLGLEQTFEEYINKLCDIFDEVKRVLRDDGTCWVNIGDTYYTKSGSGFLNDNLTKTDTHVLNTGINKANELRGQPHEYMQSKSLTLIPFRFALEMVNRGWILRNTIIWKKLNCMPSSVKDRFTVDFEYIFFFSKKKKYYFETQYEPLSIHSIPQKEPNKITTNYVNISPTYKRAGGGSFINPNGKGRNKRTVWTINPKPFKEAHFAVFPEALCETPIKAGCPEFVCKECGKPREIKKVPIGEFDEKTEELKINKSKPYSVVEREGQNEVRDLPNLKEFSKYLNEARKWEKFTIKEIESKMNSQAPHHWFNAESYPSKEDYLKLKLIIGFGDYYDKPLTEIKYKSAKKGETKYKEKIVSCSCNAGFTSGIVLDPFFGAGTTGLVALKQNKNFLGIELNKDYIKIAERRLKPFLEQTKLF